MNEPPFDGEATRAEEERASWDRPPEPPHPAEPSYLYGPPLEMEVGRTHRSVMDVAGLIFTLVVSAWIVLLVLSVVTYYVLKLIGVVG